MLLIKVINIIIRNIIIQSYIGLHFCSRLFLLTADNGHAKLFCAMHLAENSHKCDVCILTELAREHAPDLLGLYTSISA